MENFRNELTIAVVTFNHPEYIKYFLNTIDDIDLYKIYLEIHDSSTNDETEKIVYEFKKKYKNLDYIKYENINVDKKTILALKNKKTEYVQLCGDGVIPNLKIFLKYWDEIEKNKFDIIEMYDKQNKKHINYFYKMSKYKKMPFIYNDIYNYMFDNIWHLPYYGGTIVKSTCFDDIDVNDYNDIIGSGFIYPYVVIKKISSNINATAYGDDFLIPNIYKKSSMWVSKYKTGIELWAKNFPSVMKKASQLNEKKFDVIIKQAEINLDFLTFKGLLSFRESNNINFDIYKKYKEYLLKYSSCSKFTIIFICMVPKFILTIIKKIIKR